MTPMEGPMENLVAGDLTIEATTGPDRIVLTFLGKSNARDPAALLAPYVTRALAAAAAGAVPLTMRLDRLVHLNSSTMSAIVELIQDARDQGVRLVMVYDGAQRWQRVSFEALRIFMEPNVFELRSKP
jgi:hypothetical protein